MNRDLEVKETTTMIVRNALYDLLFPLMLLSRSAQ